MEGTVGEIRLFAGPNAPKNWAFCDGATLQISGNNALYSLIRTIYGGDGIKTFRLPDLRARVTVGPGRGTDPGMSDYKQGHMGGVELVTITPAQLPVHNHAISDIKITGTFTPRANNQSGGNVDSPTGNYLSVSPDPLYSTITNTGMIPVLTQTTINSYTTAAGSSEGHVNLSPCFVMQYIICVLGEYPERS